MGSARERVVKARVQRDGSGWPTKSRLFLAHLMRPGDYYGQERIEERLVDDDGAVFYILGNGELLEYGPLDE